MRSERSSDAFDRIYASLFNAFLMPSWERVVRRRDTLKYLEYLQTSQWRPAKERATREVSELKQLLSYVGEKVPYYRELFQKQRFDPRSVSALSDL